MRFGDSFSKHFRNFMLHPARGGSVITTSAFSPLFAKSFIKSPASAL